MESNNLVTPLQETIEELKSYVENQVTYNKLLITMKIGELSSYLMLVLLLLGISSFVLLFLSFAFARWFDEITKLGVGAGYLVTAGFYVILGIIIYTFRKKLIFRPTQNILGNILFSDESSYSESEIFKSKESLADEIRKIHKELSNQKEILSEKIEKLNKSLTFTNIAHQLVEKAYDSVMTTSNIAKFTYKLIKKLKWFTERKKRKVSKQKRDKLIKDSDD